MLLGSTQSKVARIAYEPTSDIVQMKRRIILETRELIFALKAVIHPEGDSKADERALLDYIIREPRNIKKDEERRAITHSESCHSFLEP